MAKLIYKNEDLFKNININNNKLKIVPHVCNDIGIWGGGFTGALDRYDPNPGKQYRYDIKDGYELGDISIIDIPLNHNLKIVNMIAQHNIKPYEKKPIRYSALVECMEKIYDEYIFENYDIHCPKFGSDLAGGNWDFIEELIREIWVNNGIDVTVYYL